MEGSGMQSRSVSARRAHTDGFVTGERDGLLDAVSGCPEADFAMAADSLDSWGRGYTQGYRQGYAQGLQQLEAGN